jgi:hypothetical protein
LFTLRSGKTVKMDLPYVAAKPRSRDQAPLNSGFLETKTSTIPATQATEM